MFHAVEELEAVDEEGQVSFITLSSMIPRDTLNVDRYKAVILRRCGFQLLFIRTLYQGKTNLFQFVKI